MFITLQKGKNHCYKPFLEMHSGDLLMLSPGKKHWMCHCWNIFFFLTDCCREGDTFQGLRVASCLTLGNEVSEETHVLTKQEILLGRGAQAESSRLREPRRTALPCDLQSWGFMVLGLASEFSLANHPDSGPFLVECILPNQYGFQWEGFWEGRTHGLASPLSFDLSWILQVGGSLLVSQSVLNDVL